MAEAWELPTALEGERLDRALALLTGLSRREVNDLIDGGQVLIGARVVASHSRKVHAGERLSVAGQLTPAAMATPGADAGVPVQVVWSDPEVIVVDKPAGLVVHPGAGNRSGTLVHGLLARFPDLASLVEPTGLAVSDDEAGFRANDT